MRRYLMTLWFSTTDLLYIRLLTLKDIYEEVFNDALVFNDRLTVYKTAVKMFAKSKKPEV